MKKNLKVKIGDSEVEAVVEELGDANGVDYVEPIHDFAAKGSFENIEELRSYFKNPNVSADGKKVFVKLESGEKLEYQYLEGSDTKLIFIRSVRDSAVSKNSVVSESVKNLEKAIAEEEKAKGTDNYNHSLVSALKQALAGIKKEFKMDSAVADGIPDRPTITGDWEWDEVRYDWYDKKSGMYYEEMNREYGLTDSALENKKSFTVKVNGKEYGVKARDHADALKKVRDALSVKDADITELSNNAKKAYAEVKKLKKGTSEYSNALKKWENLHRELTKAMYSGNASYKINDAGWFDLTLIELQDSSELTLTKLVKDVKKAVRRTVAEITNGRFDAGTLHLQVLVKDGMTNKFNWMELPIAYRLSYDVLRKLHAEAEYKVHKVQSEINEKLKQFAGKQIYKDNSIVSDSVKDSYVVKVSGGTLEDRWLGEGNKVVKSIKEAKKFANKEDADKARSVRAWRNIAGGNDTICVVEKIGDAISYDTLLANLGFAWLNSQSNGLETWYYRENDDDAFTKAVNNVREVNPNLILSSANDGSRKITIMKDSKVQDASSFKIMHPTRNEFLSVGGKTWVKEDSNMIKEFPSEDVAREYGNGALKGNFRIMKDNKITDANVLGYIVKIDGTGWVLNEDASWYGQSDKEAFLFHSESAARTAILKHNDYYVHKGYGGKIYMWQRLEWKGGPEGSFVTTGNRGIPIPLVAPKNFDDSSAVSDSEKTRYELIYLKNGETDSIFTRADSDSVALDELKILMRFEEGAKFLEFGKHVNGRYTVIKKY